MQGEQNFESGSGNSSALFQLLGDYEDRSLGHDVGEASRKQQISNWDGVVFRLGDYHLTCRIDQIEEIIAFPPFYPVPGTKEWLLGVANVRGNLAPVSDLGWFLFGSRTPVTARTRLILTKLQGRLAGLVVDEVFGQRHFHTDDLESDDGWKDTELKGLVNQNFPSNEQNWGVMQVEELQRRLDFMDGSREQ
ncbi:MAG: chemotaxis protein CheW [Pseudomonadota bacterium]